MISTSTFGENYENLWNMKVTVEAIVIGALGTIPRGLVKGLDDVKILGRVETIQTTILKLANILRRVLETSGNLLLLRLLGRLLANVGNTHE